MKSKLSCVSLVALALAINLVAAGPKITFDVETYDWGVIYQGESASYDYKVKNEGKETLRISQVKTSCGCTVAKDWPKVLEPGQSGVIKVTFNSGIRQGRNEKTIAVHSNDTVRPLVQLKIHGDIKKIIDVLPSQVVSLGTVTIGESVERTFEAIPLEGEKMKVTAVEYNRDKLDIKFEKIKKEDGVEGYLFKVKLNKGTPIGRIYENVKISTDMARKPFFELKVTGNVMGKIRAYPPRLTFSGIKLGQEERREFTLKRTDGELLEVQKITADRLEVKAEIVGGSKGSVVLVNVSAKFDTFEQNLVRMGGTIKVYTSDADQPVLDVLYSVYMSRQTGQPGGRPAGKK